MNAMKKILSIGLAGSLLFSVEAFARDRIQIVGSSTVFPFSTAVAEVFGKNTDFETPVVESTGSGGGLKLFCEGVGAGTPDITNASRRIKQSEVERCAKNGVTDIIEVKVGYDGIVLGNAVASDQFVLTSKHIFLALAKKIPDENGNLIDNPHKKWSDIDASLPDVAIEVMGPPPSSGTRDAFVELAMEGGAKSIDSLAALRKKDKKAFKAVAHGIREDGAYIEGGENDNFIIQKLEVNTNSLGIIGFSFLDQNGDKIQGSNINGVDPEFENIADGSYAISRSLYFYVKKAHIGVIPGIHEFMKEFANDNAWSEDGYLGEKGLIPMSDEERSKFFEDVNALNTLKL